MLFIFFFNDTATTEIYTLSLHDALPIFTISERINERKLDLTLSKLDQFQLQHSETVDLQSVGARPGNVLVAVRDYNTLSHLEHVLEHTNTDEQDIVVLKTRLI